MDPLTGASGPNVAPPPVEERSVFGRVYDYFFGRDISVVSTGPPMYGRVSVVVRMSPKGDEMATSFTLEYDPTKLADPQVGLAKKVADVGSVLTVNTDEPGRIGVLFDSPSALRPASEARDFIVITFQVVDGASGDTTVAFTDSVAARYLSDAMGNPISVNYVDGKVELTVPDDTAK